MEMLHDLWERRSLIARDIHDGRFAPSRLLFRFLQHSGKQRLLSRSRATVEDEDSVAARMREARKLLVDQAHCLEARVFQHVLDIGQPEWQVARCGLRRLDEARALQLLD